MTQQQLVDSLARASKDMMLRKPFMGLFLIMLQKEWSKQVPTAGVGLFGINYKLLINSEFWESLSEKHRQGLLEHEVYHISFMHLTEFNHLSDKDLANISKDCMLNQYIDEDYLPPGAILPSSFPELNLELKKGTQYYYDMLKKEGYGTPTLQNILAAIAAGESTTTDGEGNPINVPKHDWGEFEALDDATKKLVQKQGEYILKTLAEQVQKSCGNIPGEFQEILDRINYVEPPKFDWKKYMKSFTGGSGKTYTHRLRRKYNKRFEESPGLKIKYKKHILCAVDTSQSVDTEELKEFFHEIYHMYKGGTEVTVIQCDTAISSIIPYKRGSEDKIKITGRGGTSFTPVIEYANKHANLFTCLIYLTDGEAIAPEKCRMKTLWVHSSKSNINTDLIGHKIKLN